MIVFDDIILRVKSIISTDKNRERIYNKEIAGALGLSPEYFAVIKKRGKIPYEALAHFCREHKISLNWILFGQKPERLHSKD